MDSPPSTSSFSRRPSINHSGNTLHHTSTLMASSLNQSTFTLPSAIADWTSEDVGQWLTNIGLHENASTFVHERIRGITLHDLTVEELVDLGIDKMGDRKLFFKALEHILRIDEIHHSSASDALAPFESPSRSVSGGVVISPIIGGRRP